MSFSRYRPHNQTCGNPVRCFFLWKRKNELTKMRGFQEMPTGDYLLYMRIDYATNNHHGPVVQGLPLPGNFESSRQGVSNGYRVRILSRSLDRQSQSLRPRLVEDRDDVSGFVLHLWIHCGCPYQHVHRNCMSVFLKERAEGRGKNQCSVAQQTIQVNYHLFQNFDSENVKIPTE